jgi:hypothetical protein
VVSGEWKRGMEHGAWSREKGEQRMEQRAKGKEHGAWQNGGSLFAARCLSGVEGPLSHWRKWAVGPPTLKLRRASMET